LGGKNVAEPTPQRASSRNRAERALAVTLRVLGGVDLLALVAVVVPREWMAAGNAWTGLGPLPEGPLVGYLSRSASLLYALHGAMIIFLSFDLPRYWRLITFLAVAALVHGAVLFGIDRAEGMPLWWRHIEGPAFAATGAVVLLLQAWAGVERWKG
jgi:hypothetical protein